MSFQEGTTPGQTVSNDLDVRNLTGDLYDALQGHPSIKRFAEAARAAGLESLLKSPDFMTVFAPSDRAFGELDESVADGLLNGSDRDRIAGFINSHIFFGSIRTIDMKRAENLKTLQGKPVKVQWSREQVRIGAAAITESDVPCTNGVIHVIDKPLLD